MSRAAGPRLLLIFLFALQVVWPLKRAWQHQIHRPLPDVPLLSLMCYPTPVALTRKTRGTPGTVDLMKKGGCSVQDQQILAVLALHIMPRK